jgi:Tfp pilus assembly protein PilZ
MDKDPADESKLIDIISDMSKKLSARQKNEVINYIKKIAKGDEKRETERKAVKVCVDYSVQDKRYSDMIENISAGGAFICSKRLFQLGNPTTIVVSQFKMGANLQIKGEIVRLTGDGFGVRFSEKNVGILSLLQNVQAENSICRNYLRMRAI